MALSAWPSPPHTFCWLPASRPRSTGRTGTWHATDSRRRMPSWKRACEMSAVPRTAFDRDAALSRMAEDEFDVLVIGGGITGVGAALDAASRGLATALVEGRDFASGTSSKSSKLIHGGLRYLQQKD